MKIPSDVSYIRVASAEIEDFLKSKNISNSDIFDIHLCVDEVVKNAITYGNKNNKDLPVSISYSLEDNKFSVEIEDQGDGFDPSKVPDPTKDKNLPKPGGRGIFIIKKFMDEVKYNSKGNKVFMVKYVRKAGDDTD